MKERNGEEAESTVSEIFECLEEKPKIGDCYRLGGEKNGVTRPIKVTLSSSEAVSKVLSKAGRLKSVEQLSGVFLSPDRTAEERAARKKLVEQLKQKREAEPDLHHFIKNNVVFSRTKASVT